MPREFPDWINPWSAAEGRRVYRGTLPLSQLERLGKELESSEGDAAFKIEFALDSEKVPVIQLEVIAELQLRCQASLVVYGEKVSRNSVLGVIKDEAEQESLPGDYDPVLAEHGRLAISRLVEDELILGLPQVPRRPDLKPVEYRTGPAQQEELNPADRQMPFAQLGELLKQQAGNKETD